MSLRLRLAVCVTTTALLAGCGGAPPKPGPAQTDIVEEALPQTTDVAASWSTAVDQGAVADGWLTSFNDDKLVAIVEEALSNNRGLAAAAANLDVAAGFAKQAGARLAPAVNIGAGGQSTARGDTTTNTSGASLNVSWEVDVWGKLSAAAAAAEEAFRATEADFEFGRQSLAAQTAKAWFLATEANLQKRLAEEAVDIYTRILKIVQTRLDVGSVGPQDVFLAKADLASAKERQRQAQGAFEQAVRSLEVILGRYPSAELEVPREFVPVPPGVPAGVPSELLERRPDIVAAERQVAAAFQRVEAAKAAKLPSLSLTASAGSSSNELVDLIGVSQGFFSVGANLLAPIDVGGGLQAQVDIETAQQKAAIANYGQAALAAFSEVETALSNEVLTAERELLLQASVDNNDKALGTANTQYQAGAIDLLSVLQMQARLLNSRIGLIRIKNARLAQRIDLHLALGGDFSDS